MILNPIHGWRKPGEDVITWHKKDATCGTPLPPTGKGQQPTFISFGTPEDSPQSTFCAICFPR